MDHNPNVSSSNPVNPGPARESGSAAIGEVEGVAQGAKQIAGDLASRARQAAEKQIAGAKKRAADRLGDVADALRQTGDQLRMGDQDGLTGLVDEAVDKLDAASGYLQDKSWSEVVGDLERFARRKPALFFGGLFIAGLIGGRFLKSTRAAPGSALGEEADLSDVEIVSPGAV